MTNPYYRGPQSDHFDGRVFFNPGGSSPRGFRDLLRWKLRDRAAAWPGSLPVRFAQPDPAPGGLSITMVGHATLLVQLAGVSFLTDPVWSERASPFRSLGPRRVRPPGIRFEQLPPIRFVLLSHNHYDHLDLRTLARLVDEHDPLLVCPLGNDVVVREKVPRARCLAGDWGDRVTIGDVVVHYEPCHHWSARGLRDRSMALWAAFVVETLQGKIYHVGDTGFADGVHYREVRRKHGELRAAILPIGAYEPRWFMRDHHQNPDEAVRGHLLCGARTSIAHHWGTFRLTNEAIEAPVAALAAARVVHGVSAADFVAPLAGDAWHAP